MIGLAAHHHAIHLGQLLLHGGIGVQAAVDGKGQVRKIGLELAHHVVAQRGHFAVFLGRQALEPGIARMHDEHRATRSGHGAHKVAHKGVALVLVDANAVLDRDGHLHHVHHGFDAVGHQLGLVHEAGAKGTALHPLAGATAVEVDFVIAPLLTQACAMRQISWLAAAQLQGHGVLFGVEAQVARHIAMHQRTRGHHLGVQQGVSAQQPVQVAAMAVGPVHHRGDRHAPGAQGGFHRQLRRQEKTGGGCRCCSEGKAPLHSGRR